jgi:exosortase
LKISPRTVAFSIYSLCLVLATAGVLHALIALSSNNATASHHVLIPLITLALIYRSRDRIFADVRSAGRVGAGVILAGLGLALWGSRYWVSGAQGDSLSVMVAALVVLWVGGFLLFYGRDAFRLALFPLLFLGFMIPVPSPLLDAATLFLKTGSTEIVAGLFTLTGTPYYREGFVFSLPNFAIEIADECSGIRSSIALLLTSLVAGDLFLKNRWNKALLVTAVLPIAIFKNGVRIVSLSLLAKYMDPGFLTGQLHHEGGIVFFLLVLPILALILAFLGRSETEQGAKAWRV